MKDLEHDQKMLNRIGNDWYLIAIARSIDADKYSRQPCSRIALYDSVGSEAKMGGNFPDHLAG